MSWSPARTIRGLGLSAWVPLRTGTREPGSLRVGWSLYAHIDETTPRGKLIRQRRAVDPTLTYERIAELSATWTLYIPDVVIRELSLSDGSLQA